MRCGRRTPRGRLRTTRPARSRPRARPALRSRRPPASRGALRAQRWSRPRRRPIPKAVARRLPGRRRPARRQPLARTPSQTRPSSGASPSPARAILPHAGLPPTARAPHARSALSACLFSSACSPPSPKRSAPVAFVPSQGNTIQRARLSGKARTGRRETSRCRRSPP